MSIIDDAVELLQQPKTISLWQLADLRILVEPAIAREAAEAADAADIDALGALLLAREQAATGGKSVAQLDLEFHRVLARATKNASWLDIVSRIVDLEEKLVVPMQQFCIADDERMAKAHRAIYEAVAKGDGDAAARAMMEHVKDLRATKKRPRLVPPFL